MVSFTSVSWPKRSNRRSVSFWKPSRVSVMSIPMFDICPSNVSRFQRSDRLVKESRYSATSGICWINPWIFIFSTLSQPFRFMHNSFLSHDFVCMALANTENIFSFALNACISDTFILCINFLNCPDCHVKLPRSSHHQLITIVGFTTSTVVSMRNSVIGTEFLLKVPWTPV